jgi:glycosyltransferase involved in cell wall biosynthesis
VAGASGGPLDFIRDGATGYLVDGESVDAIASTLRNLLTDMDKAKLIARAGRDFALRELSWDAHAEKALSLVGV